MTLVFVVTVMIVVLSCIFFIPFPQEITAAPISTVAPTSSAPTPAPTSCVPGVVTCCFTMFTNVLAMYVNGENITASIQLQSNLGSSGTTKVVSFNEPRENATLGVLGYENNAVVTGYMMMSCSCTRLESMWTFNTKLNDDWYGVKGDQTLHNHFVPADWWSNNYTSTNMSLITLTSSSTSFIVDTTSCSGATLNVTNRLKALSPDFSTGNYYVMRKMITQPSCL